MHEGIGRGLIGLVFVVFGVGFCLMTALAEFGNAITGMAIHSEDVHGAGESILAPVFGLLMIIIGIVIISLSGGRNSTSRNIPDDE